MPLRVAVIGAGAAGLSALRHLSKSPSLFRPTAFEQTAAVGGTWVYTEKVHKDENNLPIHASMYQNLRTNLPKEVMAFPDYSFDSNLRSFIMHTDMLKYLQGYTEYFDLRKYIKFNTTVEKIHPSKTSDGTVWHVTTRKVFRDDEFENWEFDMVLVCNGHYSIPMRPNIPGMDRFKGTIIHSHDYRKPEVFTEKTVVCLGAGSSGQDISLDIAKFAKRVHICHRRPRLETPLPANVEQKTGIVSLTETGYIDDDGTHSECDVLVLCTGYKFNFPFLSSSCAFNIEDERVTPLYKHVIHIEWPTLRFIGIPKVICPFPMFDCQVQFALAIEEGRMLLPSKEDMYKDTERDFRERREAGLPVRHSHSMGPRQWKYNDHLAELAQFQKIPDFVMELYDQVHSFRVKDLPNYKRRNFKMTGPNTFEEIEQSA